MDQSADLACRSPRQLAVSLGAADAQARELALSAVEGALLMARREPLLASGRAVAVPEAPPPRRRIAAGQLAAFVALTPPRRP